MTVIVIAAFVSGIDARVSRRSSRLDKLSLRLSIRSRLNFNPTAEERMRKPLSYEDTLAIEQSVRRCLRRGIHVARSTFLVGHSPSASMCAIAY